MIVTDPPIFIDALRLAYGRHRVLDGLTLSVPSASITALLGGNGAGKSSTLAALLGFVRADGGRVAVCGVDPAKDPDGARRRIAYLPENVALYEHLSAVENVEYLLTLSGQPGPRDEIVAAFGAAGLHERAWHQRVGGLSKGMRQRVAIAVALLRQVPVMLLDEPTSGLDPRATVDFNDLLTHVRARGTAILMVTHDLLSAVDLADHIGFLEEGRIVEHVAADGPERFDVGALRRRLRVDDGRCAA
jgi:ABC-2 type transport system ATP-binding protein